MVTTIAEFGRLWRSREVSAREVTDDCLRRIGADDSRINAFILVMADEARRQAADADRERASGLDRGPLHGVPISLKDLIDVAGVPTTAASRVREGHVASSDAPVVRALRDAGAVIIGKTNLHEFAFGTTNEDSAFGPTRNPHDLDRSPGGSSGGSAASIVAGMAMASIGSDTGGSIRIPAAACGVVGLKPTYGEISTEGVVPLSAALDHVGPLAQTVGDAWSVFGALTGGSMPLQPGQPRDLRLGLPRAYFCDMLDDGIRTSFEQAIDAIRAAGVYVEEVSIRDAAMTAPVYLHLGLADAAAYHAAALESMPERYTKPVRLRLEMGRYILAEDYVRALAAREGLGRSVEAALSGHDALVLPTLPIPAPLLGARTARVGADEQPVRNLTLRMTQLFNLTGHPAVSLPCGRTPEGLPVGLQLVGKRHQTARLMSAALAVEAILASGFGLRLEGEHRSRKP